MTTQPTQNTVPSESPRDLKFNAGKIDEFVTSLVKTYIDRFGNEHYTIEGLRWLAQQAIAAFGYITIDSFQDGATLTLPNHVLRWKLPGGNGEYYRWDGEFPKVVPSGSTPNESGGIGAGAWIGVGDASLRANLNSPNDGMGDALLAVKQPHIGSSSRTQHDKNSDITSILDFGVNKNSFDADDIDAKNKNSMIATKTPYIGSKQFALPEQSVKAWNYLDGYKERGAVASFMNTPSPNSPEPVTQVLGISSAAGLGQYSDRDIVGVFTQVEGPPALLSTFATAFTATTVTSPEVAGVANAIRAGQIIDVKDAVDPSKTYSGLIKSLSGTTVTVDTAWYLKGGGGTVTGIPATGSTAVFVPNTKVWAHNANVVLNPNSQATSIVGFELGLINKKIDNYVGYGYDCVNLGTYGIGNAFQTRGKFNIGYASYVGKNYGFVSYGANTTGFYSSSDDIGLIAQNNTYGVQVKNPSGYAFILSKTDNSFVTGMDSQGKWQGLRLNSQTVSIGGTITSYASVVFANPAANEGAVYLPTPSTSNGRTIYVRNLSGSHSLLLSGPFEGGTNGISVASRTTVQLFSDGINWYPLSKYSA